MTLDPDTVYEKLTELAVGQGEIRVQQEFDARANFDEHEELTDHIKVVQEYQQVQNGNMEELASEYHADKQAREVEKAAAQAVAALIDKWGKRGVGTIALAAAAVPSAWFIIGELTGIGGG